LAKAGLDRCQGLWADRAQRLDEAFRSARAGQERKSKKEQQEGRAKENRIGQHAGSRGGGLRLRD
jgi:Zn-finger nucleic acid-binding protein